MEKNKRKWALLGGVLATALLWGCLDTVSWGTGGESGTDPGSGNPDSPSPAAPGTGIAAEEFIVTLGIGGVGPEASRSVLGPGAGSIQYGGIRNIVQVIMVNAGTGDVTHFQQEVRGSDGETSATLTVQNTWPGQRYHILVLTGHRERDYAAEINPAVEYKYKADPPTLLAAGLLANREIQSGEKTLSITMQPLLVDTVFAYGGGTVDAALPTPAAPDGTALPAGVAASIVWTVTGGIATLRDAQAGLPGGGINLNWGNPFETQHAILSLNGGAPTEASAALVDNRITLGLGNLAVGDKGSANFNLEYLPFGAGDMEVFKTFEPDPDNPTLASWIIRNGVNDLAQNGKTVFPNASSTVSPWNDKDVGDPKAANGNGAVAFSFEDRVITSIDLTGLVPAPVTWTKKAEDFNEGTYKGIAVWKDPAAGTESAYFGGETVYVARVTLDPAAGFQFPTGGATVTHSGCSSILYISKAASEVVVDILFPKTDAWEYGGYFSGDSDTKMDSAIDVIRLAQADDMNPLVLKLFPWPETADLSASGTDIGKDTGLKLDKNNSPAYVTLDGGGKTIPLTGAGQGSVITVGDGVTLTLRNITFVGLTNGKNGATTDNNVALIKVEDGGTLVLEDGAVITGNNNTNTNKNTKTDPNIGGGVGVMSGGTLVLENGAVITGNNSAFYGGGVYLIGDNSTFTMSGGTISGNKAANYGGGVILSGNKSTFTMSGGTISGNETTNPTPENAYYGGGGVYVGDPTTPNVNFYNKESTFTMSGGTISGNSSGKSGGGVVIFFSTFTMSGGTISGNTAKAYYNGSLNEEYKIGGGGVYVYLNGNFTMNGGTISGNTSGLYGGGVHMFVGTKNGSFKKESGGGVIYGNDNLLDDSLKNTAKNDEWGHAVYITNSSKTVKGKRDATVKPENTLEGTHDGLIDGWEQ